MARDFNITDIRYVLLRTKVGEQALSHYQLDETKFVLEAGCGSGKFGISMALEVGANVTLLDIDQGYLDNVMKLAKAVEGITALRLHISILQGDILALKFKDNTFDLVFNEGVVEHYPREDPRRLRCIEEMARVSRDCVIIITNDADGERTKKRAEETRHTYESMPEKETPYTYEELLEMMKKVGLLDVTVERYTDEGTQEYLIGCGGKPK